MTDRTGKYIVFCANYEHLQEMIEKVPEWFYGIDREPHIYSAYSDDPETSKAFSAFKEDTSEHLKLLFCIDMLNEGVHVDDLSGVILFRPTVSPIIYKQQIGRALCAGKKNEPVIFDVVNNIENLYSIGAIEQEMQAAINYYHYIQSEDTVVRERFEIIDELREARALFERLNETLTTSWEQMYDYAKTYYEEHGNLQVQHRYKTLDGYALGNWIFAQRRIRNGEIYGSLDEDRIAKLDAIGMTWENYRDLSWNRYYEAAVSYCDEHGHLNVPTQYRAEGIWLSKWLNEQKQIYRGNRKNKHLSAEQIKRLEAIGMMWESDRRRAQEPEMGRYDVHG